MAKKEKAYLQARKHFDDMEDEVIYMHCIKRARAYFFSALFGKNALMGMLFVVVGGLFYLCDLYVWGNDEDFNWAPYMFFGIGALIYLVNFSVKLWFWKYNKNVVVTNQGIWIMLSSTGWWGTDWKGKKHFISAYWTIYDWSELSGLYSKECAVSKLFRLKDFTMERWDGDKEVLYLKPEDVKQIEALAQEHIKPKKRKKSDSSKRKS